ncbi:DUF4013 domain-containing protein [Raoultibacter massiliensis]|uniref:DUF4013 domain-containing protein n=1 Tax=Raoultibacter massiliensis TaxID=1852371 RepID=UPI003A93C2AA
MAWEDLRRSPGWFARIALLGLVMIVPIVNFFALGYMMLWANDAARGLRNPLPKSTFAKGSFTLGFYAFAISLVVAIVMGAITWMPVIGWISSLAFIVVSPFMALAITRVAVRNQMGAAFDLPEIWRTFRSNAGAALASYWLPSLIAAALCVLPVLIFAFAAVLLVFAAEAGSHSTTDALLIAIGLMGTIGFGAVIGYAVAVVAAAAGLVTYRAMGHLVALRAPDWANVDKSSTYAYPPSPPRN